MKKGNGPSRRNRNGFSSRGAARGVPAGAIQRKRISPNRRNGFAGGSRPYDYSFYESEPATLEYLARLFARHSFSVSSDQLERFWILYDLLRRRNAELDLTRIMGIEATVLKHFVDSALILRWFEPVGPVLDIGTGPGFPALPLAIMRPDIRYLLAESRAKRIGFLREAVTALKLGNADIFPQSVREDSPLGEEFGVPVGDVVTRALEPIRATLERILPVIRPGRQAAFLKGPDCGAEVADALAAFSGVYELAGDDEYLLPGTDHRRRLPRFRRLPLANRSRSDSDLALARCRQWQERYAGGSRKEDGFQKNT
ncbi:MAG: class I SAM-dependent methyltransferase [Planctomycetota bacterium]|jgi:16S rRNA (guanine(527)-N(7))-methyltransferase RsmG|nr:class I SAM-dependent methyltransferase [Planctomycetota bacterium]